MKKAIMLLLSVGIVLSFAAVTNAGLNDGLVAYYPFNGNANDESGNRNNGRVYGATLTTDRGGSANSAYNFDGEDDYIRIPDSSSLDISNTITIAFWIKPKEQLYSLPGTLGGIIVSKEGAYEVAMRKDDDAIRYGLWTVDEWIWEPTGIVPKIDNWVFIAITYDGSQVTCYEDGVLKRQNTQTGLIRTTDLPLGIGSRYYSDNWSNKNFHGVIDDVCIYNRVLSQSEINELYSNPPFAYQCATLDGTTWAMTIPSVEFNNSRYAVILDYFGNYRWVLDLGAVEALSGNITCATLDSTTWVMGIPCVELKDSQSTKQFTATLNYLDSYIWQLGEASLHEVKLNVPFVDNTGNTCVASSFTMVLQYYGAAVTLADVLTVVGTSPFSDPSHAAFANWIETQFDLGMEYLPNSTLNDVERFLTQGYPVVVHQQSLRTEQTGHNRVVIGYDALLQEVILNDPSYLGQSYRMAYTDFEYLWKAIASFEPVPPGELFLITPK